MTPQLSSAPVFFTIGSAAIVTYLLRFGGLMLASKLPNSGRWKRFMDALPGTILLSLIAPEIVSAGWWGGVGTLATAVCAYKTKNVIVSMLLGVAIVAVHRQF
jgi:uncharacterized membrane protein